MREVNNKTKGELIEELEALRQCVTELVESEDKCERSGGGLRNDCQELLNAQHDLRERIKELSCLYRITQLMVKPGISLDKVFNGVVNLIKAAWQYPEITCARIIFDGKEFKTGNFRLTKWKQSSDIRVNSETAGALEVYYLEEKPRLDEGPFLKEEKVLIEGVARELGNFAERKQMEEKLKESEERYRALLELDAEVGEAVIMLQDTEQAEAVQAFVSDAWTHITGYSREELLGSSFFDFVHPKYRKTSMERHRKKMAGENMPGLFEMLIVRKDGAKVPIELTSAHSTYKGKRANVAYIRDITERKKAEESLRLQSEIIANMSEGVYIIRASDGVIVHTNPKFEEIFGYSPDEMVGKYVSIVNAPTEKSPEETANEIIESINRTGGWRGEIQNIKKDGTPFWCYASVAAFDHPVYGEVWIVIHTDITESKRDEEELRASEEKLRLMFNSVTEGITVTDLEGKILQLNDATASLHGYDNKEELTGRSAFELIASKDHDKAMQNLKKTQENGSSGVIEYTLLRKDESEFTAELNASILKDASGNPAGFIAVTRDITERKRTEKELRRSESRLRLLSQRAIRAQEEERARIARELHDQVAQELVVARREALSLTESLKETAAYNRLADLVGLVDKLLDTVHNISIELRPKMLDELGLVKVLQWYTEDFEHRNGISCLLNTHYGTIQEGAIRIEVATAAYRIFQEAMVNILRHSKADKVIIDISIRKGRLIIAIKDNGIGIDTSRLKDRSSLGLLGMIERASIVGGSLQIRGNPGRDTRVTMYLPLQQA